MLDVSILRVSAEGEVKGMHCSRQGQEGRDSSDTGESPDSGVYVDFIDST